MDTSRSVTATTTPPVAVTKKVQKRPIKAAGAPAALKLSIGALSRVAPGAAAWLVERLWFTPPRPPIPAASRARLAEGQLLPLTVDGRQVRARSFGRGPTVALMHGWGGYGGQLADFIMPLVAAGFRVVVFDALGHGDSPGSRAGFRQSTFFDFRDGLLAITEAVGPLHAVVAHSGGAMATLLALRAGLAVERLVLLAPMARPALYAVTFGQVLGLGSDVTARWQERVRARLGLGFADLDASVLGDLVPPPTLVLHDRGDREVPFADGEAIAHAWPRAELAATENLGHRRILHDRAVLARTVEFLTH